MVTEKKELQLDQFSWGKHQTYESKMSVKSVARTHARTYTIYLSHTEGTAAGLSPPLCPRGTAVLFLEAPGALAPLLANG